MAIVFVSPQRKQRLLIGGISLLVILILAIVSFIILLPEIKNQFSAKTALAPNEVAAPTITVNFSILDSDQFKKLESFHALSTANVLPTNKGRIDPFISY